MKHIALITGGSRGIGLGIAQCLAREGLDLAICGLRDESNVAETMDSLRQLGADVLYIQADVGDSDSRRRLVRAVEDRFGRLNVLVNNAGMAPRVRADILEATEESFVEVLRTNLEGPYFLTQACARWMIAQKQSESACTKRDSPIFADPCCAAAPAKIGTVPEFRGCIVNISSVSATMASTNRGEYCISKAGVAMASQLWAARLGPHDIPVFEIRPGIIHTDMTAAVQAKYDKLFAEGLAVQSRWGMPEDVGRVVASLVRGDFAYSTGQVFLVDGGLTVPRL
jgi:3-oxoacyl-[acyl-carrier protein] reductase